MLPIRHARIGLAPILVVAFTLAFLLSPSAGAQERRDQRDAPAEETPVVLQIATVPDEERGEPESPDSLAIETAGPDPEPCPEGWAPAEPPLNPDLGCLPQNVAAGSDSGGGGGDETQVAVATGQSPNVIATDDLAVQSGTITIIAHWCPSGPGGFDYDTATLAELWNGCQEPGYVVDFGLDLGYWSGSQTIGDVIPGGVFWEPPLSPETIKVNGPATASFYQTAYCDSDYDGVGTPDYVKKLFPGNTITAKLTPTTDDLYCAWFLTPIIAGIGEGGASYVAVTRESTGCPDGYRLELLLQEKADGSLWWSYGCIPDGSNNPTGPDDATGGSGGGRDDHPGNDSCPDGWEPAPNPALGCVPSRVGIEDCPEGSAIHPHYPEYGCIPYGQGPWAP